MRGKIWGALIYICLLIFLISCEEEKKSPNILFISIDDLRTELGCYGNKILKTPNIDKVALEGVLFANHYVQVPTCGASRQCLLTGMRPRSINQLKNNVTEEETSNKPEGTLPESFIHHLKRNGYYTVGIGKISHSADGLIYAYDEKPSNKRELPFSWDELVFDSGKWGTGWNAFFAYANGENRQSLNKQVKPYEAGDVEDNGYVDGLTTKLAIKKLRELKANTKPFFLGVGYFKPHLPFNCPQKYWDLYNRDSISISPNPYLPTNVNNASLHQSAELNNYLLSDELASLNQAVSEDYAKKLRQAYYACVSYIDQQVGLLIKELQALDLDENTIIVIWGDNGWHLGDQQVWGKHTLFDNALNTTLIIKVPGVHASGKIEKSLIETVDIYPSLLELCGVTNPNSLDGESFAGLLYDIESNRHNVAYSYFNRGITIRTNRYRLSKYFRMEEPIIELYDHVEDPYEANNIASMKPEIVDSLMPLLEKGNTGLYEQQQVNDNK
ncbi:sulfatase [Polaribacter staleyi]|uniref:sulfatase n=1 Tax=Polaribacter staleyi TaxID=2022337 RepID=UPI0031BA2194